MLRWRRQRNEVKATTERSDEERRKRVVLYIAAET
ncbi:uncharacterized protein G2W53_035442 [Senna tora]|uniref:Uncharacterized protein n=1 Tax=Senna tora TaxID=362788 RepID=A0A834W992_9FABA|nr:uncharacterized protein G2W53_035442 [Senna tora]